jgi:hypothetical protein
MPDQRSLNEMVRNAIDDQFGLPKDADAKLRSASNYNLLRYLLTEITKAAVTYALQNDLSEDEFEYNLLPEAIDIVRDIQYALVTDPHNGDVKNWRFWKHEDFIIKRIKNKDVPLIDRSQLESAATRYLDSPLRTKAIDRVLIDSLMAMEVFAFGDEMLNPEQFFKVSPLKTWHVLWTYLLGQAGNLFLFGIIIGVVVWLRSQNVLAETTTGWAIGILIVIFLLMFALATLSLPGLWMGQRAERKKITNLLGGMVGLYNELKSDGAISAPYIRQRAQTIAAEGAVWPAPLFAVLDDVVARTGRF